MTTLQDQLKEQGYKEYYSEKGQMFHNTKWLYQKLIKDEDGVKLYYINTYYYPEQRVAFNLFDESIQFEAQFYYTNKPFDVVLGRGWSIEEAEGFIRKVFVGLYCDPME